FPSTPLFRSDLLPFAILGIGVAGPMQALHHYSHDVERSSAAAKRVGALLAAPELPVSPRPRLPEASRVELSRVSFGYDAQRPVLREIDRSEEHTFELQSREKLVCRLL